MCPTSTQKGPCKNKAYWWVPKEKRVSCGVHARDEKSRVALPKRSTKEKVAIAQERFDKEDKEIEAARVRNENKGRRGHVAVSKLRMLKAPEDLKGYRKVFPNFKHGGRKDGLGMPALSPMSLGPVKHPQPGLPIAAHIEGLHQGNKVFPQHEKGGKPTKEWLDIQREMYEGPPRRHHPGAKSATGSKNIPLYSRWVLPNGKEKRLSYVESRQVYCTYYERLAKKTKEFRKLMALVNEGTNIQIHGYDGYDLEMTQEEQGEGEEEVKKKFEKFYLDEKRPFGHELVLAALLLLDEEDYPWTKYTTLEL